MAELSADDVKLVEALVTRFRAEGRDPRGNMRYGHLRRIATEMLADAKAVWRAELEAARSPRLFTPSRTDVGQ